MRYISISQSEIQEIKRLHESVLSKSSGGLFYSIGRKFGRDIAKEIQDRDRFFEEAARILKDRNIVEDISFDEKTVTVKGSIEVRKENHPTCDVLRGMLQALYRAYYGKKVYCEEIQCESTGADKCIFEMREEVI
ncbi:MAG TPA: hypothetical protein ENG12_05235 [Candidatus Altiarchaeales archaeon]|nr:hypothetical protein [Candidatus Altiarchaeales archaeon]